MHTHKVDHPEQFNEVVEEVLSILPQKKGAHVLALSGDLGSGKTTFVKQLGKVLGVLEHIVSPTFVIMRTYSTHNEQFKTLVHIDAYRVEHEREVAVLKIGELFKNDNTIICIEWPEKIPLHVPKDALMLTFTIGKDETRTIMYNM